jgi:hypothetical protein
VPSPTVLPRRTVALVACLAAGALPAREARAEVATPRQEPPVTPYVNRGILYGPAQGGITLGLGADTAPLDGSIADASLDVALGLTRYLTVDASLGTLSLSPRSPRSLEARYHSPEAGLWLGLVDTPPLEIDAAAHVTFGVGDESILHQIEPGGVAVLRIADEVRIDAGVYLPASPDGKAPFGIGLRVPVSVAAQVNPYLHAAVSSGVTVPSLREGRLIVPFGVSLGVTLPLGAGGYAVISPSLSWPSFSQGAPGPTVLGASLSIVTPP